MEKFDLHKVKSSFEELKKRQLPTRLANIARNFFAASWRKQGWDDGGVKKWKEVQRRIEGTPEWKWPKKGADRRRTRQILMKSGATRRAVQDSVKESTFDRIRFLVDIPYAGYLNDGTEHMDARPFMKNSRTLEDLLLKKIEENIDDIWKIK